MRIIGLCGKKGVGKNYVSNLAKSVLEAAGRTVAQMAFADDLKTFCVNVLGLTHAQCYGSDADKNTLTRYKWSRMPGFVRERYPAEDMGGCLSARRVLQIYGTDLVREFFDDDIWINSVHRKISNSEADVCIISDVRFDDECRAVWEWGGKIWYVDGPQRIEASAKADTHSSENGISAPIRERMDLVINNWEDGRRDNLASYQVARALELST